MRDAGYFLLALGLAWLPLPPSLLTLIWAALLLAQVGVAAKALLAPPGPVWLVARLQDAVLFFAILLAGAVWREGNPWPQTEEFGPLALFLGVGGLALYLKWMVHHQRAHEMMSVQADERLTLVFGNIRSDEQAGFLDAARRDEKMRELQAIRDQVVRICTLGRQAAGQALLQLGCLAVALGASATSGLILAWVVAIALPGLVNSKAQDLLLRPLLPTESRLC